MRRNILVTGATGKQGAAFIRALQQLPTDDHYFVYAVTRDDASPAAQHLAGIGENIVVVKGDLDMPDSISKIFEEAKSEGGIWGVFAVLAFPGLGADAGGEEAQGKMLADLALQFGVSVFVYSSAMRAGPEYEDELTLSRRAKANIENYCIELGTKGLPWVILRPGFFMENFDNFIGSVAAAVLRAGLNKSTTIGMIASDDIGHIGAGIFGNPERYKHKVLVAVSEFVTMSQLDEEHLQATGKPIPAVPSAFGWLILKMNKETQHLIASIERNHSDRISGAYPSCDAEVSLANSAYRMRTYYERTAQSKEEKNEARNWNQVSLWKLATGRA
ncbi:hypothetical protein POJ06DRAFT_263978 [Lipomyces tetrasporus]|uniref:NmrA-like domain-containing protein n=1 Tax=Lipomyces tetrasporus TaxID=54092 RepID=A0AAD7QMA6_9ASCO|nr:uncharacterized protein POJ06DRAFT_263978 [Lipomyces tetrasporus]KAJ8096497.1 hypothetical protein POJ06DRAFT_263978 [Lipomyces tetrasporus]